MMPTVTKHCAQELHIGFSAHAREGYSSHFVCLSVCVSLFHSGGETYIYILGNDLSPLNVALFKCSTFLKIEAILEKKRVELRPLLQ